YGLAVKMSFSLAFDGVFQRICTAIKSRLLCKGVQFKESIIGSRWKSQVFKRFSSKLIVFGCIHQVGCCATAYQGSLLYHGLYGAAKAIYILRGNSCFICRSS